MKNRNSNIRLGMIRWLMVVSFLVLILFVGQWITAEYLKEQNRLNNEYARKMQESTNQVMDSLLVVHVVDPVLQESAYQKLSMDIVIDSIPGHKTSWQGTQVIKTDKIDTLCNMTTIKVIADSLNMDDHMPQSHSGVAFYSNQEALLQGVRLFVERLDDSTSTGRQWNSIFAMQDTARIKDVFALKAATIDPMTSVVWSTQDLPGDSLVRMKSMFRYYIPSGQVVLEANISNAGWIVLKQLVSSFVFGLVLLLLTGGSFVLAFRSLKKQTRLNEIRSGLLGNISHELKTPVATVKIALEALQRFDAQKDPEQSKEYLTLAGKELNRLEMLVEQVMTAAFAEQGGVVIRHEETDLHPLISEVVALLSPRIKEQGAGLTMDLPEGKTILSCDPLHVQGVLTNLLDNALKYGGEKPKIEVSMADRGAQVMICIRDHGPGIPEEYKTQVFEKFFRVPGGDTHNRKGYGLGLSYVAMVVEQHGGYIQVKNEQEGGVSFSVFLPKNPLVNQTKEA
jgi:signal transduction histidine kinase